MPQHIVGIPELAKVCITELHSQYMLYMVVIYSLCEVRCVDGLTIISTCTSPCLLGKRKWEEGRLFYIRIDIISGWPSPAACRRSGAQQCIGSCSLNDCWINISLHFREQKVMLYCPDWLSLWYFLHCFDFEVIRVLGMIRSYKNIRMEYSQKNCTIDLYTGHIKSKNHSGWLACNLDSPCAG